MKFHKYQALGNDYLVLEPTAPGLPSPGLVRRICHRHFGVGSDGLLVEDIRNAAPPFLLRIINPDGSEAEKSGNGLRIFAKYLHDTGRVGSGTFEILTKGGLVQCQVQDGGALIHVDMGRAVFDSTAIPVAGPQREVVSESIEVGGERLRFTAVSMGNPHCVVHTEATTAELARRLGPLLERHAMFPNRTNVQFVQVLDRAHIKLEIWERGAGYTLASGSSSCAAAAASVRLGLCDNEITVVMPGGNLGIRVSPEYSVRMSGPAMRVYQGTLADGFLRQWQD